MAASPRILVIVAVLLLALLSAGAPGALAQTSEPSLRPRLPDGLRPLEGMPWRLRAYLRRGSERPPGPEVAAWIQLRAGRLTGSGGCDNLRGRYATAGATLQIEPASRKASSCAEQTSMVQQAVADGLAAAAWYELIDGPDGETELLIHDESDATVLRFGPDDVAGLEATEWLLDAYVVDGVRTTADAVQPAVLSFQPRRTSRARRRSSGELVGSTGCNGVIAGYARQADILSIGELERTGAPCSGALATQEEAIVALLDSPAVLLRLPPDRLLLSSEEPRVTLELVSSTPLTGTTWLLDELPGAPSPPGIVTLRLADGRLDGEGPCGSYAGRYASDGAFITISDLEGSAGPGCSERALERQLLGAIRRSVVLDRSDGDLALRDAAGTRLARFTAPGSP